MKKEFIDYILQHRGKRFALAKILGTKGSTPRKAGTTMIVHEDGSIFGTIGGGRAENEIRLAAINLLNSADKCIRFDVGLNDAVAVKEGMVCGGKMDVWVEIIS